MGLNIKSGVANMKGNKNKRHFYICLFLSVLFTINLIKSYMNTGSLPASSTIFTVVVYIATLLAASTLKGKNTKDNV